MDGFVRMTILKTLCAALLVLAPSLALAAHPLITDDTGTQGKGKFQLEVNAEFGWDRERGDSVVVKERHAEVSATFSAGVHDAVDVVVGAPYQWYRVTAGDAKENGSGAGDVSVELKWRFYDRDGLSFAIKPGITIPIGDEREGFGAGRVTYGAFFITQWENGPWEFMVNLGYLRNENSIAERKDIWHGSFAVEYEVFEGLELVGNIGIETDPDPDGNTPPAFGILGLIYSITEDFDVDFGMKAGLNRPETDMTLLAGIAWRF